MSVFVCARKREAGCVCMCVFVCELSMYVSKLVVIALGSPKYENIRGKWIEERKAIKTFFYLIRTFLDFLNKQKLTLFSHNILKKVNSHYIRPIV